MLGVHRPLVPNEARGAASQGGHAQRADRRGDEGGGARTGQAPPGHAADAEERAQVPRNRDRQGVGGRGGSRRGPDADQAAPRLRRPVQGRRPAGARRQRECRDRHSRGVPASAALRCGAAVARAEGGLGLGGERSQGHWRGDEGAHARGAGEGGREAGQRGGEGGARRQRLVMGSASARPLHGSTVAGISDEKLQELRDRVDVVAVVQRRVSLKKSGRDWKGLYPFHGEKTPSFYVVPDKRIFHCFGCGATGDAIQFVMQLDGKSFREAAEQLAGEAGVDLKPEDPEEARRSARRAALAEVNEKACVFYERVLWEHPRGAVAREHLEKRGVAVETARAWRLGYASDQWDQLCKSMARGKVDAKLVEEAGLGVPRKKQQGFYDRFRGRLMIPIREAGRTVGFGGRLLEGESEAKYLNSPDTPLYTKGGVLFALDKARDSIRREGVAGGGGGGPRGRGGGGGAAGGRRGGGRRGGGGGGGGGGGAGGGEGSEGG